MPNSRLVWPTHEELRQRYELMGRMMETRGVDVVEALRVDGGLAFIEARAGAGSRVRGSAALPISALTPVSSGPASALRTE
jgi:hypothetical protein